MMEEKVVLSTIFRNFSVSTFQKQEDLKPLGELILRPKDGMIVELHSRWRETDIFHLRVTVEKQCMKNVLFFETLDHINEFLEMPKSQKKYLCTWN